ncbi:MAG: type II/IV secretion system ATPase subunit, partial [Methanolinea sp.]
MWHIAVGIHLAQGDGLPIQRPGAETPWQQEGSQPPLYYALLAAFTRSASLSVDGMEALYVPNPHACPGDASCAAGRNIALHGPEEAFPWRGIALTLHLWRLISVGLGLLTVLATVQMVRLLFPDRPLWALGSGLLVADGITAVPVPPLHAAPPSDPSLARALRDVDLPYAVAPPFQFVHVYYDEREGALRYEVLEPALSDDEQLALSIVEKGFEKMISTNLDLIVGSDRAAYLKEKFLSLCHIFGITATPEQQEKMFFHLAKKYLGYSHMDTLMKDKYIEDISCNGADIPLYVMHRIYGSVQTNVRFGEVELNNFVLRLAQMGGRHISLLQPIRDVTLPDGSRANLTLGSEVTRKGSTFTIRKFRSNPISPVEMMEYGTIDAQQLAYLWILMEYKRSILVSGGTATGKTTMLNVLCSFIPSEYKIVSIEDTAELNLLHPNWIQSVTRTGFGAAESPSASVSGISGISWRAPGDISLYDLLVAALRQRPEFIIVGEVRGD